MNINQIIQQLENVKRKENGGYTSLCPAHSDEKNSLSIDESKGKILLTCFSGCKVEEICNAMGIKISDLFVNNKKKEALTISDLANAKGLPEDFLKEYVKEQGSFLRVIYKGIDGNQKGFRQRVRTSLEGSEKYPKFFWNKGEGKVIPYGIWKLTQEQEYMILVEGESDTWTLWYHSFKSIGIPGVEHITKIKPYLSLFKKLYIVKENDKGGDNFIAKARKMLEKSSIECFVINPIEKDVNALYLKNRENFVDLFNNCIINAIPIQNINIKKEKQELQEELQTEIVKENQEELQTDVKIFFHAQEENNTRIYQIKNTGIYDYAGNRICSQPVIVKDKVKISGDEQGYYVTLSWFQNEIIVPLSYLQERNHDKLANRGIEIITKKQAKEMANYFCDSLNSIPSRLVYRKLGWHGDKFVISGIENERNILPESKLEYKVENLDSNKGIKALKSLVKVCENASFIPVLLTSLLAPAANKLRLEKYKFACFVVGQTGNFKTTLSRYAMSIYGKRHLSEYLRFGEGATMLGIIKKCSVVQDLPILLDNYKPNLSGGELSIVSIITNVVEGKNKLRLNKNGEFIPEEKLGAWPIITGEASIESDTSAIARCILVEFRKTSKAIENLQIAEELEEYLPAVGYHWINWLSTYKNFESIRKEWKEVYKRWHEHASQLKTSNAERVAANFSALELIFKLACECPMFSWLFDNVFDFQTCLNECLNKMSTSTTEAREGQRFLDTLSELISSGSVILARNKNETPSSIHSKVFVGWDVQEDELAYFLPEITLKEVKKIIDLRITKNALYAQLDEMGVIQSNGNQNCMVKKIGGCLQRVLAIKREFLIKDSGDD